MGTCEHARERIPAYVAGRLDDSVTETVAGHLAGCAECAAEADLARLLVASCPEPAPGLAERVRAAVRADLARSARPAWALSAAAVAALALGIGVSHEPEAGLATDVPAFIAEVEEGGLWMADDGVIAGGLALEGLSDEALSQLLDDLATGGAP